MGSSVRWWKGLLGLLQTVLLPTIAGLGLASLLIQSKWLDLRADLGALSPTFVIFAVIIYLLNQMYQLDHWVLWENKKGAWLILLGAPLIILIVNRFSWDALTIVPASTLRDGFKLTFLTLNQVNILLVVLFLLGIIVSWQYQKIKLNKVGRKIVSKKQRLQIGLLLAVAFIFTLLYLVQPGVRYFVNEASAKLASADIEAFKNYLQSFGIWAPILSAVLMILQSVVAPLPAFVITFANGMLFGAFWGGLLSWSSAMLGAALCYWIARSLGRPVVEKLVSKSALDWTDRFFDRYGKHSVLLARLLPIVSFDLVSYGAGLTSMRFWGFFVATGIGQAPATILYSYLGQTASGSVKILFWVFIIVICLAILIAAWKKRSSLLHH